MGIGTGDKGRDEPMFGRKKRKPVEEPLPTPQPVEKPTPAYLRDDYPYKAVGDPITDLSGLENDGTVYEIRCPQCETTIRSQGANIRDTYERLMAGAGCLGCGNKELIVKRVDMSAAPSVESTKSTEPTEPAESSEEA